MSQQIQLRNDSTANWDSANPVLAQGEIGVDTTLGKFKIGNGTSTWSQLDYHANSDLVVPTAIKDTNGDDLITFERTSTGTARIATPQDDLSLRSARDITLIAGDNGPGNVYIGWGDATITPDATNRVATIADIQAANTADFVFTDVDANNSSMTITGDKEMTIESGADSDLNVRAGDQLWLTAGNDVILQADDTVQVRSLDGVEILSNYVDMGNAEHRWEFTQGAELILPGGGIIFNAPESSSDGGLLSTLSIIPDATNETNQYVVLDPTGPNHIHIRAGGPIDESTAELILGGERNKVAVSDSSKSVVITTAAIITNTYVNANEVNNEDFMVSETSDILIGDNIVIAGINHPVTYFSPDPNNTGFSIVRATGVTFTAGEPYTFVREEPYENYWQFSPTGVFSGPAMGGVKVPAITNIGPDDDLYIYVNGANAELRLQSDQNINLYTEYGDILLSADGGVYIGSASPENEIATAGDIAYRRVSVPVSSIGQLSDVAGLVADDASYHYYCTGSYDGDTHIWKRVAWDEGTWSPA